MTNTGKHSTRCWYTCRLERFRSKLCIYGPSTFIGQFMTYRIRKGTKLRPSILLFHIPHFVKLLFDCIFTALGRRGWCEFASQLHLFALTTILSILLTPISHVRHSPAIIHSINDPIGPNDQTSYKTSQINSSHCPGSRAQQHQGMWTGSCTQSEDVLTSACATPQYV